MSQQSDVYARVTAALVEAIEQGAGDWIMPWARPGVSVYRPLNAVKGNHYHGINTLMLWATAHNAGYESGEWATFKQWQEAGAQVRKGEKGTLVVFYSELEREDEDGAKRKIFYAKPSYAFNAAQVDGYEAKGLQRGPGFDPYATAENVMQKSGADIREGGTVAAFSPEGDYVMLPDRDRFLGDADKAREAFYGVAFHELTHWTGGKTRLDRDLSTKFKSEAYAMEELVAEIGAAFLCADVGLSAQPRPDHSHYLAHWLAVLKQDNRAIFKAASAAEKAAQYLIAKAK